VDIEQGFPRRLDISRDDERVLKIHGILLKVAGARPLVCHLREETAIVGEKVTVGLYAAARVAAGRKEAQVAPGTLTEVLAELVAVSDAKLVDVLAQCSLLLDGLAVHEDPGVVVVAAGSQLDVLPPFAGG
jgi:molybdopterin synthase sulfur carrier subunit